MEFYGQIDTACQSLRLPEVNRFHVLSEAADIARTIKYPIPNPNQAENLKCLRPLLLLSDHVIRTRTIRLMRLLTRFPSDVDIMTKLSIDALLIRCLDRDPTFVNERTQTLRFINAIISLGVSVPRSLMVSLISLCAFSGEDPEQFTQLCLETLRSILLSRPTDAIACNAMRVVVQAILEPRCTPSMCTSLVLVILSLIDSSKTRHLIRRSLDLQPLFAAFTRCAISSRDFNTRCSDAVVARGALVLMLRSWTGLFYLADDSLGLRSIISMLKLPDFVAESSLARELVFDLIFDVFNEIRITPAWSQKRHRSQVCNLLCNYLGMVVLCLVECGLIDALLYLGINSNKTHSMQATSLLSAILNISATLLPTSYNIKLNELTSVVAHAIADKEKQVQSHSHVRAKDMLTDLQTYVDSYNGYFHNTHRFYNWINAKEVASRNANRVNFEVLAIRTECNGAHFRADLMCSIRDASLYDIIDENALFMMLKDTRVMDTAQENHSEWEIDACLAIMQGPLLKHPSNIMTVLNKTKFLPRLTSFMHPSKGSLTMMKWDAAHIRYMRLACSVTRVLCVCGPESASLLTPLVEQLVELLQTVLNGKSPQPQLFSRDGVQCGAGRLYLIMIGIMSESIQGARLLEKTGLLDLLEGFALNPSLDFMTRIIACHLDYSRYPPSRAILNVWLENGSVCLRRFLCQQMFMMMRLEVDLFEEWGLPILVKQVMNQTDLIAEASYTLEQACEDPGYLVTICKLMKHWKRPSGNFPYLDRLLLRFAGHEEGIKIAQNGGWIQKEIAIWEETESALYVSELESALMAALNFDRIETSPRFRRSTPDFEWYVERLHDSSFDLSLVVELANGREHQLVSDCVFEVVICPERGILRGRVTCYILDERGFQSSYPIPSPDINIRAVLFLGSESLHGQIPKFWYSRNCSIAILQSALSLIGDSSGSVDIADGTITWRFSFVNNLVLEAILFSVEIDAVGGPFPVCPAPHLFGQLAQTQDGSILIRPYLHNHIRNVLGSNDDQMHISLWNLALTGSSPMGFELLKAVSQDTCIITHIAKMAACYPTLSTRATCYYILGIWSMHHLGREHLSLLGWDFPQDVSSGIAVPSELHQFLHSPDPGCPLPLVHPMRKIPTKPVQDPALKILDHITKLTNHVTRNSSQEALMQMYRSSVYRPYFRSPAMYLVILNLMSHYNFQISMRRFIHFGLFSSFYGCTDFSDSFQDSFDVEALIEQVHVDVEKYQNRDCCMPNNDT